MILQNFILNKYKIPVICFLIFVLIGIVVWIYRDIRYFYLFSGIGTAELITRIVIIHYPHYRQLFRLLTQGIIGGFLLLWISIYIGVNFQFPQIFFDASAGVVTGALIQTVIARLILPFFFGNAFCSRACWSGFFFEFTNSKKRLSALKKTTLKKTKPAKKRSEIIAWSYLLLLVVLPISISFFHNPADNDQIRRYWIIGENIFILSIGFILTFITGSRSYCRLLCPFITISGLFSRFSLFKITPVQPDECTQCNLCNKACPMLIDVCLAVNTNSKISDKLCIVCERCVSACSHNVLKLTNLKIK